MCKQRVSYWVRGGSDSRLLPGNSLRHNFFANDDAAGIGVAELKLQCLPVKLRPESDAIGADELRWPADRSWSLNIPVWSLGPRPCFSINFWPRPEEYVQIEHRKWAQWVSNLVGTKGQHVITTTAPVAAACLSNHLYKRTAVESLTLSYHVSSGCNYFKWNWI